MDERILFSTGLHLLKGHCPASPLSNSQPCKAENPLDTNPSPQTLRHKSQPQGRNISPKVQVPIARRRQRRRKFLLCVETQVINLFGAAALLPHSTSSTTYSDSTRVPLTIQCFCNYLQLKYQISYEANKIKLLKICFPLQVFFASIILYQGRNCSLFLRWISFSIETILGNILNKKDILRKNLFSKPLV